MDNRIEINPTQYIQELEDEVAVLNKTRLQQQAVIKQQMEYIKSLTDEESDTESKK